MRNQNIFLDKNSAPHHAPPSNNQMVSLLCNMQTTKAQIRLYIDNFMTLASFFSWADRFESYLVENSEDRFSRDEAHMGKILLFNLPS